MNVPGPSLTIWPTGHAFTAACIAAESSPPLGDNTAPHRVRLVGIPAPEGPPLDIIPGFQGKFLSDGIIVWASTSPAAPSSRIANVHFVKRLDMIASQSEIVAPQLSTFSKVA